MIGELCTKYKILGGTLFLWCDVFFFFLRQLNIKKLDEKSGFRVKVSEILEAVVELLSKC